MSDDYDPDAPQPEWHVTVRVLPRWRVCHNGRAYEAGELLELPVIQACEWSAWGSVTTNVAQGEAESFWKESDSEPKNRRRAGRTAKLQQP